MRADRPLSDMSSRHEARGAFLVAAALLLLGCGASEWTGSPSMPSSDLEPALKPVNIDFMLRGYFYAGSTIDRGIGGNATSGNMPRPLSDLPFPGGGPWPRGLHLVVLPDERRAFDDGYEGLRVVIANASGGPVDFDAQDGRLSVVQEALYPRGLWAPLEYLPSSWCGNSYHTLTLPDDQYWDFTAPRYRGSIPTFLRFHLQIVQDETVRDIYSSEFMGSVSSGQLTIKQGHMPMGIMDPYDE